MTTTDIKLILTEEAMEETTFEGLEETTTFVNQIEDLDHDEHYHLNEIVTEASIGAFIGYGIMIGFVMALAIFGLYKGYKKLRRDLEYNRLY